jgi:hypothetical protein
MTTDTYQIALVRWFKQDGMAEAIRHELVELGHEVSGVMVGETIPAGVDYVLTFGPFGEFLQVPRQLAQSSSGERPQLIHWSTEGMPDLRLPWAVLGVAAAGRSWVGRMAQSSRAAVRGLARLPGVRWLNQRGMRYRFVGDYVYSQQQGWFQVFAEISEIYARRYRAKGLPAVVAPWGATPLWAANLNLPRDIDVLWMGKRASRRRSERLDRVRAELRRHNIEMYVADGVDRPFIFGKQRTEILNRAKITLNLIRTWHDDNFVRFAVTAPNRSMIVSEPLLPHCPSYEPGRHYITATPETLAETIRYYIEHETERHQIAEAAHELVTTKLTLKNSLDTIVRAAAKGQGLDQMARVAATPHA